MKSDHSLHASMSASLFLISIMLSLASPACQRTIIFSCDQSGDFGCAGPDKQTMNVGFEIAGQPSLYQSNSFWLRDGEQLAIRWDTYRLHIFDHGNMCDYDYCNPTNQCSAANTIYFSSGGTIPIIEECEGFMQCDQPVIVPITYTGTGPQGRPRSGCRLIGGAPPIGTAPSTFTPPRNGTYQAYQPNQIPSPSTLLIEKKVFVIAQANYQMATYQLVRYPIVDPNPIYSSIVWFTWSIGGAAVWDDNFSNSLQVTKVRILKGRAGIDAVTGMLKLEDATPVRPSSIVLSPAFDSTRSVIGQNRNRCYADTSVDGNIDISQCRGTSPAATPTYLKTQQSDRLTWIAEFNPNETQTQGATAPTLNSGEVLAIEFTIQTS